MSKQGNFIEGRIGEFLRQSRNSTSNQGHIPPNLEEVNILIEYLSEKGLDPIIVGSVAVYTHLRKKRSYPKISLVRQVDIAIELKEDVTSFGFTKDIDLFISKKLPPPPPCWKVDKASLGVPSWISPSNGYVDFLIAGHIFPDNSKNPMKIEKDAELLEMGCAIADLKSLFLLKLNSSRPKDFTDLLALAHIIGIPGKLIPLNETQKENLELLEIAKSQASM